MSFAELFRTRLANRHVAAAVIGLACAGVARAQSKPASFPFTLNEGRPFVQATVNGKAISLLLDLGAYDTIALSAADALTVSAKPSGKAQAFSTFDGKQHETKGVQLDAVILGTAEFGQTGGSAMAGDAASYVGAGLLAKHLLVLDYVQHQVRLYASGDADALRRECGTDTFPVDVKHNVLQSYLRIQGKVLTVAFDTGANYSVLRPSVVDAKVAEYVPGVAPSMRELRDGRLNQARLPLLNTVLIEFKGPAADMVLGTNFFDGHITCLDAQAQRGARK